MLPVIEIPLLQQSQCQYHNNFFCHVVYERIQEHGGSKVFHLSETSVCGHFLTFQVSCAKIVYCIAAVRVVALWMIFALITLFFLKWNYYILEEHGSFGRTLQVWMEVFQCLQILMMFLLFTQDVAYIIHFIWFRQC